MQTHHSKTPRGGGAGQRAALRGSGASAGSSWWEVAGWAVAVVCAAVASRFVAGGLDAPAGDDAAVDHHDLVATARTGDVLVLSYGDARTVFSRLVYGSVWNHAGVVWCDATGEPHVVEGAVYSKPYNSESVTRTPLLWWLRVNRNCTQIAHLALEGLDADARARVGASIDAVARRLENSSVGIEPLGTGWLRFLREHKYEDLPAESFFADEKKRIKPRHPVRVSTSPIAHLSDLLAAPRPSDPELRDYSITCHEIAIYMLQEAGVFERDLAPSSYLPSAIPRHEIRTRGLAKFVTAKKVVVNDAHVSLFS